MKTGNSLVGTGLFWLSLPDSGDKNIDFFLAQGGYISHEQWPAFSKKIES